ncbi:MAG: carbohydrate-binding module family 20 domain-containing protein, partial [Bacteroidota bacterium]
FQRGGQASLSEQDMREIKFWFHLANFDPDFLERKQSLANGMIIDLTDLIEKRDDGRYFLRKTVTEDECNRIIAEAYKVCSAVVPIHRKLMYNPATLKGQIEIVTTSYYHPILPLIYDSDLARLCQGNDPMPSRFHYPRDAEAQVAKAVEYYKATFGGEPRGMWPAEGSVAHDIIPVFANLGISWIATDEKILARSRPGGQPCFTPYAAYATPGSKDGVVMVFRETELSDKIGFVYQNYGGEDAAGDFINGVFKYMPGENDPDRLLTVILDGENAWEWYRFDNDGKGFQNGLYRRLSELYRENKVITSTVTEYLLGNPHRGIPAHPIETLPKIDWVWPGSWINANFDTWIGDHEENRAWEYLLTARKDLEKSGIKQPDPRAKVPKKGTKSWYAFRAWESLYAAEGSDWFWWYGTDQNAPSGEKPFDIAYITHLKNIYRFGEQAGGDFPPRTFRPIIPDAAAGRIAQGTMAQSSNDLVNVVFQCDARDVYVRKAIYVAGNHESLGAWVPNKIKMFDDGTHGDTRSDGIWTLEVRLPAGVEIEYKFTNSGAEGSWSPGEEFAGTHRTVRIERMPGETLYLIDRFGHF